MRVIHDTPVHLIMSQSFWDDEICKDLPLPRRQLHVSQYRVPVEPQWL